MKKIIIFILCSFILFHFTGCLHSDDSSNKQGSTVKTNTKEEIKYEITYKAVTETQGALYDWVKSIVEIENTGNVTLYFDNGAYDLEYPDGTVVDTKSNVSIYPSVIDPGEKCYFFDEKTIDFTPTQELVIVPRFSVKKAALSKTRLEVTQVNLIDTNYSGVKATGRINNNTGKDITSIIYVAVVLFDSNDKPFIILTDTIFEDLPNGGAIGYEATSLYTDSSIKASDIKSYKAFSYPWQVQY